MLFDFLSRTKLDTARPAVIGQLSTVTWGELIGQMHLLLERFHSVANHRVGIAIPAAANGLAAVAALDGLPCQTFLFDGQMPWTQVESQAATLGLEYLIRPDHSSADGWSPPIWLSGAAPVTGHDESSVTILTSGTAGQPKAARHTWETLARPVRISSSPVPQTWLLTYRIHLYAGLQVALQALLNQGTLVMPDADSDPDQIVELMRRARVEYASATPSYWRRLVLFADREQLARVPLKQITLGGEAIDQQILDSLSSLFPTCRIVHIYATTELGRCFSVSDRRAGFPLSLLNDACESAADVQLKIEEDQLYVRSGNAMRRYDELGAAANEGGPVAPFDFDAAGWFATGDMVAVEGDRVHFVGRQGDRINVGGNKVDPLEIEKLIRSVRGVADVRVFAKSSSLAGQLVACELVADASIAETQIRESLAEALNSLASYQRPRFIEFVERITLTTAGKSKRHSDAD